jgi:hypothetical protein
VSDYKEIPLSRGKVALVSAGDYDYLNQWKWSYGAGGYAVRNEYNVKKNGRPKVQILMHRLIMDNPQGMLVDHKNGERLDNRRANLRLATHADNQHNRNVNKNNTSGFRGVTWCKQTRRWRATTMFEGKSRQIGRFLVMEDAVQALDSFYVEHHGEFARLHNG